MRENKHGGSHVCFFEDSANPAVHVSPAAFHLKEYSICSCFQPAPCGIRITAKRRRQRLDDCWLILCAFSYVMYYYQIFSLLKDCAMKTMEIMVVIFEWRAFILFLPLDIRNTRRRQWKRRWHSEDCYLIPHSPTFTFHPFSYSMYNPLINRNTPKRQWRRRRQLDYCCRILCT